MGTDALLIQLRSLEAQLAMARARIKKAEGAHRPFAAFYGMLAGIETTEQDLESAKLKVDAELT
jgi:hypothetical protein